MRPTQQAQRLRWRLAASLLALAPSSALAQSTEPTDQTSNDQQSSPTRTQPEPLQLPEPSPPQIGREPPVTPFYTGQQQLPQPGAVARPQGDPDLGPQPLLFSGPSREFRTEDVYLTFPNARESDPFLARERQSRRVFDLPGTTVIGRRRPLYDPIGYQTGSFTIFPSFTARQTLDTNVYNSPDATSDVYATLRGDVIIRSDWGRHELIADGFLQQNSYLNQDREDSTTYRARINGRFDISREAEVFGSVEQAHLLRDRTTLTEVADILGPVLYELSRVELGGRVLQGRIVGEGRLTYARLDFDDTLTFGGAPFSRAERDFDSYQASARIAYALTPTRRVYVSGAYTATRYPNPSNPLRDANETQVLVGVESDITPVIRGRIALGYLRGEFIDPRVEARDGIAADVDLDWLVTELTTIHLQLQRNFDNVANSISPASIATIVRLSADHELYRNVIVSPGVRYQTSDFVDSDSTGGLFGVDLTANWLINQNFRAGFSAAYRDRQRSRLLLGDSNGSGFEMSVSLTVQH